YSTVSPEIHSTPPVWSGQDSAKPITSPTIGWLSGGPWRHGVAVTSIGGLASASRTRVPPPARPTAEAARARRRRHHDPGRRQQRAAGGVEVVLVVVVRHERGVDRPER